jgi:hypothetical protein
MTQGPKDLTALRLIKPYNLDKLYELNAPTTQRLTNHE